MPNRKIKHIVAKLVGATTEETLDVYDIDAVHNDKIKNDGTATNSGFVLDARQANPSVSNSLAAKIATNTSNITSVSNAIGIFGFEYEYKGTVEGTTYSSDNILTYKGNTMNPTVYSGDTSFLIICHASSTTGRYSMHLVIFTSGSVAVDLMDHSGVYPELVTTAIGSVYVRWSDANASAGVRVAIMKIH